MYAQPGLGGFGSKLKKVVKKVEKVTRPLTKVAAVVGTAMFAPALLPTVAGAVIKPKASSEPVPEAAPAAPLPAMLPAVATPAAASAAPPLPQLAPNLLQPAAAGSQMFAPAAGPSISITQPGQVQAQSDEGTKKLLLYGGLGLGAMLLLTMAQRGSGR